MSIWILFSSNSTHICMRNRCRKEKKELLLEKKARKNKNFPIIQVILESLACSWSCIDDIFCIQQETVSLWEQLRRRDVPADKRAELVTSILKLSKGRIADLTGSHTASRVVQSCLKYGNKQNRATILSEVEPKMVELSKSPYGRFVVSKLITTASKEELAGK